MRADVQDCPELELVLPARKEAVKTGFLKEMRAAARLAIYRAMAADPCPAFEDWTRAREAGIAIAPPPAMLRPWRPCVADAEYWRDPPKPVPAGPDAMVMASDPEPPEAQTLWRAAERAGLGAVYDSIVAAISDVSDAIVLDFVAGSGTTGHAVFQIN